MIHVERRPDGLVYVLSGLSELMAAIVDEQRTVVAHRAAGDDCETYVYTFETRLSDGARISGEYVPAELPGFRTLDVRAPEATREDQERIMDEHHAIPPTIPARD